MVSPRLYKTIFEVRYKAELKFYDLLLPAAQQLKEYPDWETNRLRIILKDFDKHCNLAISHNSFSYEQDSNDINLETNYISRALEILPTALEINAFTRLGYRRRYLVPVDFSYESLVTVLNVKLFSQNNNLIKSMPKNVKNLAYIIDSEEENYKYHFLIGPVTKQESQSFIGFNRERNLNPANREERNSEIIQTYPNVAIFIDIDMYHEGETFQVKERFKFVDNARNKVHNLAEELTKYLLEEKLE